MKKSTPVSDELSELSRDALDQVTGGRRLTDITDGTSNTNKVTDGTSNTILFAEIYKGR